MAKVKNVPAPVMEKQVETPKAVETFEDRVKISVAFQERKRAAKGNAESFKEIQIEERKWLESIAKMLEPEIKKNGFMYKLVKRGEKTLMYAQHILEGGEVNPNPCAWEVFVSKISTPKIAFKKQYEAYEMFPGNGVFGSWAWSCQNTERAEERFQNLEKGIVEVVDVENDEDEDDGEE